MTDHTFTIDQLYSSTVYDSTGSKIGNVQQVYTDDTTGEPQFVTVNTGLFGTRESFVPVRGATARGDELHVPYTKDFVKDAPNIDADGHMEENEQDELFRYYDYSGTGHSTGDRDVTTGVGDRDVATGVGDRDVTSGVGDLGDTTRDHDLDDDSIVRREEQLRVGTERVETGRLRIRKHVVTEQQTVTVPVEREEFEVVREPLDGTTTSGGALGEDEIAVTTHEERPVVDKEVVDAERIGVERRTVADQERVQAEVAKEEVDIERDGDTRR